MFLGTSRNFQEPMLTDAGVQTYGEMSKVQVECKKNVTVLDAVLKLLLRWTCQKNAPI